ncbi:hypothetical protein K2173_008841 [Erythroxylum novogranatense]|uniref:RING-type E3 ubiquitin transferase n=1 Tax=Erythroxylum novogranatense TaxID=1862640 RepID=A0AAV8UD17_9ROSI|nr:hypothetical protein K2173_008841 [Erythroxylum novogranatense]
MDDHCAVCADALEWVAYGACGHREVCSTCVARLRFICDDRRCCICKTTNAVVFITKALGDYTRMISDFTTLPSEPREGRVGPYWYHEDTQAFFDDVDHYRMIKAMCRLSCSVCDKMEEENEGSKRRTRFRSIEQLKGHLFHRHKLHMCSLCLEGRKVFICEQKLYSRSQLNQHISTGDSEVDGDESERGGFMGHPVCEFCKTPFYGDNELYSHMSTEHYTCHICQRQHPGQYEYYKNYDDLEMHFRRDHFLCEDEACLAKKFIVFQTETEMKRHNTVEHGGRMSRSKRNAALQIPTSFQYRRSSEQDRRGRRRTFLRDQPDTQLSLAIQASLETSQSEGTFCDPSSSSTTQAVTDHGDINDVDSIIQPFESLSATDSETSSRYLHALGQSSRGKPLQGSSFPPLPIASSNSQQKDKHESESLPNNTMAAHLRRRNNVTIVNSGQTRHQQKPVPLPNTAPLSSRTSSSLPVLSNANSVQVQAAPSLVHGPASAGSLGSWVSTSRINNSASAPNLSGTGTLQPLISKTGGSLKPSITDFPPVSAANISKNSPSSQGSLQLVDVQAANKSLVEKIRTALKDDEEKYSSFKEISGLYRQGSIDTREYLDSVHQFGLTHLILDLARLCPDAHKQQELVDTYNASLRRDSLQENDWVGSGNRAKGSGSSKKGKGLASEDSGSKDRLADSILSTVRTLQIHHKPQEVEVEVLSKDGYRGTKGKSSAIVDGQPGWGGGSKQKKKTSKFHRVRLGDGSVEAFFNNIDPDPSPGPSDDGLDNNNNNNNGNGELPVRGVWRKGGNKLFS